MRPAQVVGRLRTIVARLAGGGEPRGMASFVGGRLDAMEPSEVVFATCLSTMDDGVYVVVRGRERDLVIPWRYMDRLELRTFLRAVDRRAVSPSLVALLNDR